MKKPYKLATCGQTSSGYALLLDGKPAHTPGARPFVMQHAALGRAVAEEWQSQAGAIRKEKMPLTAIASIAIDLASQQHGEVFADLLAYAETDLVCYRAGDVADLASRQKEMLDPILAWAEERFGIKLEVTDGVIPVSQPSANRARLEDAMGKYDPWKLAALAACVKPLGSLILALALVEGRIDAGAAFDLAHLEEAYGTEKWGRDEEKEARMEKLAQEIASAERFLALLMSSKN